jgi:hypothetical protein
MFFTGGVTSFAERFSTLFPTHREPDGLTTREVPPAMVALVATGVCTSQIFQRLNANTFLDEQLYAALHEWRTGIYQPVGFSANTYLDVYYGHINTFNHVTWLKVLICP